MIYGIKVLIDQGYFSNQNIDEDDIFNRRRTTGKKKSKKQIEKEKESERKRLNKLLMNYTDDIKGGYDEKQI